MLSIDTATKYRKDAFGGHHEINDKKMKAYILYILLGRQRVTAEYGGSLIHQSAPSCRGLSDNKSK